MIIILTDLFVTFIINLYFIYFPRISLSFFIKDRLFFILLCMKTSEKTVITT